MDSDIIIYSTGNQTIIAGDFSIADAKKIKKIIEERIQVKKLLKEKYAELVDQIIQ